MNRLFALAAIVLASIGGQTCKAAIEFTGGGADVTFYYESAANRWDVVLRSKGGTDATVATGLTSPYTGFTGIVGLGTDFNFNPTLTTSFTTDRFVTLGSTTYAVSRALGSPFNSPSSFANNVSPDLGIRTRLRENENANQFDSFNLTLNLTNSTFNGISLANAGSPAVSLLSWSGTDAAPMIDSANGQLTANFENYAHVHRNWGFSESGNYVLGFDIAGVGGTHGNTAGAGSFSMGFNVSAVPEPSSLSLIAIGFGLAALRRRRRA